MKRIFNYIFVAILGIGLLMMGAGVSMALIRGV